MTKPLRLVLTLLVVSTICNETIAQNVAINTDGSTANPSSLLDVKSTNKGVLIPRMSKTQKNAIASPATGLLVFQETPDSIGFHYYNGTAWVWLSNAGTAIDTIAWKTTGNTGLNDTSFLGHRDLKPLNFRVNNVKVGRFDANAGNYFIGYRAGNDAGTGHVALGDSSGAQTTNSYPGIYAGWRSGVRNTGNNNTFLGPWSGETNTTGSLNTYVGAVSGRFTTTGSGNAALGMYSLYNNTSDGNTAVGYQSMLNNKASGYNTAVGIYSMINHRRTSNSFNTAIGSYAMEQDTFGYYNTAVGTSSLRFNLAGFGNTALGVNALYSHRTNNYNTAVGFESMVSDTSGDINTAIGWRTLRYNKAGQQNTALGVGALEFTDSTERNTAVGRGAMIGVLGSKGISDNVAVGYYAGASGDSVKNMVVIGANAGGFNNRDGVVAIGAAASYHNSIGSTNLLQGAENTAIGFAAMTGVATGSQNVAIGYKANAIFEPYTFYSGASPSRNVAIGDSALIVNRGNDNVGVGYRALSGANLSTIYGHVAVGSRALIQTTATYPNTAIGLSSLDSSTTGGANTAVGSYALMTNKTGVNNTALGNAAMYQIASGDNNTAIGNDAMRLDSGSNNTGVGAAVLRYIKRSNTTAMGYAAGLAINFIGTDPSFGTENTAIGFRAMAANATGRKNTALGFRAMATYVDNGYVYSTSDINLLSRNTAIGDSSQAYSFGQGNTSVGNATLSIINQGDNNTVMGDSAMGKSVYATQNDAFGQNALKSLRNVNADGFWNTAVGSQSMENDTSSYATVALGFRALRNPLKTDETTALGVGAMEHGTRSNASTAVGRGALFNFGTAEQNTAVGYYSMSNKRSGVWNTSIGNVSLEQDTTGQGNTGIGVSAFRYNYRSNDNVGVGINSGYFAQGSGSNGGNTYIGSYSGVGAVTVSTGINNAALGYFSMNKNTTGSSNVAVGVNALYNNTTGAQNVAVGQAALYDLSTGTYNTATGYQALTNAVGNSNSAFGYNALMTYSASGNAWNNAFGDFAAENLASGTQNVMMGSWVMRNISSGTYNTAIGNTALYGAPGATSVQNNTAIGGNTLSAVTSNSAGNTALGVNAGQSVTSGTNNTLVGYGANVTTGTLTNASAIGYNSSVSQSNSLILGNTAVDVGVGVTAPLTKFHIYEPAAAAVNLRVASSASANEPGLELVKVGGSDWKIRVGGASGALVYARGTDDFATTPTDYYQMSTTSFIPSNDASNTLGTAGNRWTTVYATVGAINTSDARDKENIADLNYGLNEIMKLRPVSFTWKENPQWGKKIGFIAQEVQPVLNEVIQVGELKNKSDVRDDNPAAAAKSTDKLGIYYSDIIPVTVKAIQEQQKQIDDLKKQNEMLLKRLEKLENK